MAENLKRGSARIRSPIKNIDVISSTRIFIGNLPFSVTKEEIHQMFDPIGTVKDIFFCYKNGQRRYVFLEMESIVDARTAINHYNNAIVNGRAINCRSANPRRYELTDKKSQSSGEEDDLFSEGGKISEFLLSLSEDEETQTILKELQDEKQIQIKVQTHKHSNLKVDITSKKNSKSFSKNFKLKEKISLFNNSENYSFNQ